MRAPYSGQLGDHSILPLLHALYKTRPAEPGSPLADREFAPEHRFQPLAIRGETPPTSLDHSFCYLNDQVIMTSIVVAQPEIKVGSRKHLPMIAQMLSSIPAEHQQRFVVMPLLAPGYAYFAYDHMVACVLDRTTQQIHVFDPKKNFMSLTSGPSIAPPTQSLGTYFGHATNLQSASDRKFCGHTTLLILQSLQAHLTALPAETDPNFAQFCERLQTQYSAKTDARSLETFCSDLSTLLEQPHIADAREHGYASDEEVQKKMWLAGKFLTETANKFRHPRQQLVTAQASIPIYLKNIKDLLEPLQQQLKATRNEAQQKTILDAIAILKKAQGPGARTTDQLVGKLSEFYRNVIPSLVKMHECIGNLRLELSSEDGTQKVPPTFTALNEFIGKLEEIINSDTFFCRGNCTLLTSIESIGFPQKEHAKDKWFAEIETLCRALACVDDRYQEVITGNAEVQATMTGILGELASPDVRLSTDPWSNIFDATNKMRFFYDNVKETLSSAQDAIRKAQALCRDPAEGELLTLYNNRLFQLIDRVTFVVMLYDARQVADSSEGADRLMPRMRRLFMLDGVLANREPRDTDSSSLSLSIVMVDDAEAAPAAQLPAPVVEPSLLEGLQAERLAMDAHFTTQAQEADTRQKELDTRTTELSRREVAFTQRQIQLDAKSAAAERRASVAEEKLATGLAAADAKIEALTTAHQQALQETEDACEQSLLEAGTALEAVRAEADTYKKAHTEGIERLENQQTQISMLSEARTKTDAELATAKADIAALTQKHEEKNAGMTAAHSAEIESLRREHQQANTAAKQQAAALQTQIDALSTTHAATAAELAAAKTEITALTQGHREENASMTAAHKAEVEDLMRKHQQALAGKDHAIAELQAAAQPAQADISDAVPLAAATPPTQTPNLFKPALAGAAIVAPPVAVLTAIIILQVTGAIALPPLALLGIAAVLAIYVAAATTTSSHCLSSTSTPSMAK